MTKKIGIAGLGAIGSTVARALVGGIDGLALHAASDPAPRENFKVPMLDFEALAAECDVIVECLPAVVVPALCDAAFKYNKDIIIITSAALIIYPEILNHQKSSQSQIHIPSGALAGLDGVRAMMESGSGIRRSRIISTKHPRGFSGAPFVTENQIDLNYIKQRVMIFSGNAIDAAKAFPANVNVAATLSLAGIGPERTEVEIWADPAATGNTHEIIVEGEFTTINTRVDNIPDPGNPKTSLLAAQSVIAALRGMTEPVRFL
jgi:aspartate dehydrogenase